MDRNLIRRLLRLVISYGLFRVGPQGSENWNDGNQARVSPR